MIDPGGDQETSPAGRRILLLVGSVGAGKGTQAAALSKELGLAHVASGNLFRKALRDGTELQQRDDDRPEVVRARLAKQVVPMLEVLDYYDQQGIVHHVDGTMPIPEVTREILEGLRA